MATLCFIPKVAASHTVKYKEYKIGDEITVSLDKQGGTIKGKFYVIASSAAGEEKSDTLEIKQDPSKAYQYVTAIYDGTIGESVYAENPSSSIAFANSNLLSNLVVTATDKGWVTPRDNKKGGELRLLTSDDIQGLFGKKNPSASEMKKYSWLSLGTPYWLGDAGQKGVVQATCTSGSDEYDCSKEENAAKVIDNVTIQWYKQDGTAGIRPVIKIHKGFIDGGVECMTGPVVVPDPEPEPTPTPKPETCPGKPSISIQSCIDSGKDKDVCIEELCKDKPIVPPDIPVKEEKFCPNDKKISIQSCIDGGAKESDCISKLCPGGKKPENPKTGTYISFGILLSAMVAGFGYLLINKKKYFRKI